MEIMSPGGEGAFTPGKPLFHGALGVFPLHLAASSGVGYLTYDEALEKGTVAVSEVSEGGSVPELRFLNRGSDRVLLIDGEQLVGAKQNRILNTTVLIEAKSSVVIPVSCVEAGRWHYSDEENMRASRSNLYATTRAKKSRQVSNNLRGERSYRANQNAIWNDISGKLAAHCVFSPTSAMEDHFASVSGELDGYRENLRLERFESRAGTTIVGAVFTLEGTVLGMDAFDSAATLEKQWGKLLNSYAMEAVRVKGDGPVDVGLVGEFLGKTAGAHMEVFQPPGLGDDVRMTDEKVVGSCLVFEGSIVHGYAFNLEEEKGEEARPGRRHSSSMTSFRERKRQQRPRGGMFIM